MTEIEVTREQRNQALNAVAQVVEQRDEAAEKLRLSWEALDACIASGQVPDDEVPKLIASIPDFGAWRQTRHGKVQP
jgi:hypothetical protein